MTPEKLREIEQRWANPLQEKWRHVARAKGNIETESGRGIASCHVYASNVAAEDYLTENLANADRIIAAPTDIATLLAEVRRLQKENVYLKVKKWVGGTDFANGEAADNG